MDKHQRDAMRTWPTHEEHGEPGFVVMRHSILVALLDDFEYLAEAGDRMHGGLLRVCANTYPHNAETCLLCAARKRWEVFGA